MRSNTKVVPTSSSSSSSKNTTKQQEQPHLSGAYIRSLVKQLSSSSTTRSKDHNTMTPHDQPQPQQEQAQQAPPHKKQVRRRLHTSRPYQERLLNMAEARREIVTALKIHRATMRQAKEQQQQQQQQILLQQQQQQQQEQVVVQEQSQARAMSYASFSNYLYNSPLAHFTTTTSYDPSALPWSNHTPIAPMAPSFDHGRDDHFTLPTQPLGLNLSFQGFHGVVDHAKNDMSPPLIQPSPTSSYSYSSPSTTTTMASHDMSTVTTSPGDASLHRVLDDEEMAVIYSIGERHDIEWSDTVNLVTSAWWSKLLESVEGGDNTVVGCSPEGRRRVDGSDALGMMMEDVSDMPDWLCDGLGQQGKESNCDHLLEQHFADYYHQGRSFGEDITLPHLDIGEIEGWDGEWLS